MSASPVPAWTTAEELQSFRRHLRASKRILALCGAGLSAASGLPTFRGAGGLWRNHESMSLATPEAFRSNPGLVWQFYGWRRHMALSVRPNKAHYALAELAKRNDDFWTLTQNVDGLSPRAKHPDAQLHLLHGSLLDVKCSNHACGYIDKNNTTDPLCPALASASDPAFSELPSLQQPKSHIRSMISILERPRDGSDSIIPTTDLPQCPECSQLLRPGVVWFGESLPVDTLTAVDAWISAAPIDLMLVIGTSAVVWPAAGYIDKARARGAGVAVINTEDSGRRHDWFFQGDASDVVPEILKDVIGDVDLLIPADE